MAMGAVIAALMFLVTFFIIFALCIASYVMRSLAVYRLAKRRNIESPWAAWIPVVNVWIFGRLAENWDMKNGHKRNWGAVLLISTLATFGTLVIFYIFFIILTISAASAGTRDTTAFVVTGIIYIIIAIIMSLSAVVLQACNAICMFKIFESTVPEKALKYFLLSLLVPLAYPICLIKCKDKGYPFEPQITTEAESAEEN